MSQQQQETLFIDCWYIYLIKISTTLSIWKRESGREWVSETPKITRLQTNLCCLLQVRSIYHFHNIKILLFCQHTLSIFSLSLSLLLLLVFFSYSIELVVCLLGLLKNNNKIKSLYTWMTNLFEISKQNLNLNITYSTSIFIFYYYFFSFSLRKKERKKKKEKEKKKRERKKRKENW